MREQRGPVELTSEAQTREPEALAEHLLAYDRTADAARTVAASQLAVHLERMTAGPSGRDATVLVQALDQGRLTGLADEQGRPLRALAIEALLRLGYPWALRITPSDLTWYRAQAPTRRSGRERLAALAVLLVALAGVAWWDWPQAPEPPTAPAGPTALTPRSQLEVFRAESGARTAKLSVDVPAVVSPRAEVELGNVRAIARSGPPIEVLKFSARHLATRGSGGRTLELVVPLIPERFEPNRRYSFEADVRVDGTTVGTAVTPMFDVTSPPVRKRGERPTSMAESWAFDGPDLPRLRAPTRLLLGIDSSGRLLWSQFLQAGLDDRLAVEAYLRDVKQRNVPMFKPKPAATEPPCAGVVDWALGPERVAIPLDEIPPPWPVVDSRYAVIGHHHHFEVFACPIRSVSSVAPPAAHAKDE